MPEGHGREAKERGIEQRFSTRLEADLQYLAEGLLLPHRVKNYEKVLTRIGRLRQRYSRVARYYDIRLEKDAATGNAKALVWTRIIPTEDTLPGVYCLRTNQADWDESTLWNTYTMLTDLEAAFRNLKSDDIQIRPIYQYAEDRVRAHMLLCMLAYYVKWHMNEAWRGLLFADEDQKRLNDRDPVAPATRSDAAIEKIATKILPDGSPAHSFRTLLNELATIVRNTCRRNETDDNDHTFDIDTTPNAKQRTALELINAIRM